MYNESINVVVLRMVKWYM